MHENTRAKIIPKHPYFAKQSFGMSNSVEHWFIRTSDADGVRFGFWALILNKIEEASDAAFEPVFATVPDGLHVDELTLDPSGLLLLARTTAAQDFCSHCGHTSSQVHSRYWRTLRDLP